MNFCPSCEVDVVPTSEILPDRNTIVSACPRCDHTFEKRDKKAAPAVPTPAPAPKPTPLRVVVADGDNMVERVRSRIAALEVELERMASLKREHSTLRRMLRAAERQR